MVAHQAVGDKGLQQGACDCVQPRECCASSSCSCAKHFECACLHALSIAEPAPQPGDAPPYRPITPYPNWILPPQAAGEKARAGARSQHNGLLMRLASRARANGARMAAVKP